jgi:long-chain acyl-CoA synthetase
MNQLVYADLLHHACISYAERPALHIKREGRYQTWTYGDLHRDLNRLTSVLGKHGLAQGRNAAVIGENSPEWAIAFHAILLTGACVVPIDPNITAAEIESIMAITGAKIVFCSPAYAGLFGSLQEKHGFPEKIVLFGDGPGDRHQCFAEYLGAGDPKHEAFGGTFGPRDPMAIIFTSGTTGRAKGVVLCQENYTAVSNSAIPRMKLGPGDIVLSVLPLHHVFGFAASLAGPLCGGMEIVFVPYLKGPLIVEALRDKNVTMLPVVPKMVALFYESVLHNVKKKGPLVRSVFAAMQGASALFGNALGTPFRRRLFASVHRGFGGNLKLIISGGAALGKKYWSGFTIMGFNILEGYGLTETFGPICVCPAHDPRFMSVGPALKENEIKIAGPNDDGIGEVLLRGSCIFLGYYKNETLTGEVIDNKEWFHTGDLGRLDADGFLYLCGRKKDVIVLDTGKNVYPDELEDYYEQSPLIEEIGVFGVQREEGEIVAAAIVPCKEVRKTRTVGQATDLLHDELVRLGKELPIHRRISDFVTLFQPLPRTTTRKLKKQELIKLYGSIKRSPGVGAEVEQQLSVLEMALMESDEYRSVISGVCAATPRLDPHAITPRSNLEIDLGLDSLDRIELLSAVERSTGITLPEQVFDKMETIADLVSLVKEQKIDTAPATVEKVMGLKERILDMSYFMPVGLPVPEKGVYGAAALMRSIAALLKPVTADPADPCSGAKTPVIFAVHHTNVFDAFWLLQTLPERVAAETLFLTEAIPYPWFPYKFYRRHRVALDNNNDPIEKLKTSLAIVHGNRNLITFPEGKLSSSEKPGGLKAGIGLLARETGAPIIPVKKTGGIMRFGTPFTFADAVSRNELIKKSSSQEIAEFIRKKIIEL